MFSVSRFGELFQAFPKSMFQQAVDDAQADRKRSRCRSWDVLLLSVFGQLNQSRSLRACIDTFNAQHRHHYHLGTREMKRSTVSDALSRQDTSAFKQVCEDLIAQSSRSERVSCRELLYVLDSSCIKTPKPAHDWSEVYKTRRGRGLKLHLGLIADSSALHYANITPMNVNDISDAKAGVALEPGVFYAVDKGYCDYGWWSDIDAAGAYFVTRLKRNAALKEIESHPVSGEGIVSDSTIHLSNTHPGGHRRNPYAHRDLRRIEVKLYDSEETITLVTNAMHHRAEELAQMYKKRWQIETFFRWLKQKLKLKTFLGCSENAIRLQIYCALIAYLLVRLLHRRSGGQWTLSAFARRLQATLFERVEKYPHYYRKRREKHDYIQSVQPSLL